MGAAVSLQREAFCCSPHPGFSDMSQLVLKLSNGAAFFTASGSEPQDISSFCDGEQLSPPISLFLCYSVSMCFFGLINCMTDEFKAWLRKKQIVPKDAAKCT